MQLSAQNSIAMLKRRCDTNLDRNYCCALCMLNLAREEENDLAAWPNGKASDYDSDSRIYSRINLSSGNCGFEPHRGQYIFAAEIYSIFPFFSVTPGVSTEGYDDLLPAVVLSYSMKKGLLAVGPALLRNCLWPDTSPCSAGLPDKAPYSTHS